MSNPSWMISILLFVAVLGCKISAVGSSDVLAPFWELKSPMCYMSSSMINTPIDYQYALQRYRNSFTRASTEMVRQDRPFLPFQTANDEEPIEWIAIKQCGWDGDEVTLLFRADNMYLIGFANKTGTWFSFIGYHHLIPGSIPLNIGADYTYLIGGWYNMHTVPLGWNSLGLAVRNLSSFDESTSNMHHGNISTTQLIVMFPEAVRFFPIREKIIDGWYTGAYLDKDYEQQLLVSWKDISGELRQWYKSNIWMGNHIRPLVVKEYSISNEEDALRVVDVVLTPHDDGTFKKKRNKKRQPGPP